MTGQLTETIEWSFPGESAGLVVATVAAAVVVFLSYRYTLRRIPSPARWLLGFLRILALGLILACLCNPTRIQRQTFTGDTKANVAVIFDVSGSMRQKSSWGESRLEKAMRYWRDTLAGLEDTYRWSTFAFAESLRPIESVEELRQASAGNSPEDSPPPETALYRTMSEWIGRFDSQGLDGVICLTDGRDSTGASPAPAVEALRRCSLPHAFVLMDTPLASQPYCDIEKLEVPSTAQIHTNVPVNVLIRAEGLDAGTYLEWVVTRDGKVCYSQDLDLLSNQSATQSIRFELPVLSTDTRIYEGVLKTKSDNAALASAKWSVTGQMHETPSVLLYQGALDWGTRHLRTIFDRETNGQMQVHFAPGSYRAARMEGLDGWKDVSQLSGFNVVILMNMSCRQVSSDMVDALERFVRDGGGLLVINGNPHSVAALGNSDLARLLPATVENDSNQQRDQYMAAMEERFDAHGASKTRLGDEFIRNRSGVKGVPLLPFEITREGWNSPIFSFARGGGRSDQQSVPHYECVAGARRIKPGATVLACTKDKQPILVVQPFGSGHVGVLACDSLWRWKLSLPSDSQVFPQFWRQLVGYLCAASRRGPAWIMNSSIYAPDETAAIRFHLPSALGLEIGQLSFAAETAGRNIPLTVAPTDQDRYYETSLEIEPEATYRLVARENQKVLAEAYISGKAKRIGREMQVLKPDRTGLDRLAIACRGVSIDPEARWDWTAWLGRDEARTVEVVRTPLWHRPWVFAALLAAFLMELIVRRRYRMA